MEGLELYDDHRKAGFTKNEIEQLKEKNKKGKGFDIENYKKNNVNDFHVKKRIGETKILEYQHAKTEKGLKKMHDALVAHKTDQLKKIKDAVSKLNTNSTVSKYYKEIHKNIKILIKIIDDVLLQMTGIYPPLNMIPLYSSLAELKPELNGVLYSTYISSKITEDTLSDLSTFIIYIQGNLSTKLKTIQPILESLYSLSNENTSDKHKEYLNKLNELNIIINKTINLIQMIKIEDITNAEQIKKDAWIEYNIDQMLDNEVIQPEKRKNFPNAKW